MYGRYPSTKFLYSIRNTRIRSHLSTTLHLIPSYSLRPPTSLPPPFPPLPPPPSSYGKPLQAKSFPSSIFLSFPLSNPSPKLSPPFSYSKATSLPALPRASFTFGTLPLPTPYLDLLKATPLMFSACFSMKRRVYWSLGRWTASKNGRSQFYQSSK